jgi:hypothetical protein
MRIGWAVLAAWGVSCSGSRPAEAPPEEFYFRSAGPLDSRYLHLRPDGTFQFYFRAHFATQEGLHGTWRRTGDATAALRCEHWSRQVLCDPIRVRFGSRWADHRRLVRDGLEAVLKDHPGQASFERDELENAVTWDEERELLTGREIVTVLPLSVLEERVPRAALERTLAALEGYEQGGDPHEIHVRLHRHRSIEFVEWIDWSAYNDPRPTASVRAEIETLEPGETLADVWTRLSREEYERELLRGEPFKFFKRAKK